MVFKRSAILLAAVAMAAVASTEATAPIEVQTNLKNPVVKSATHANGKLTLTLKESPKHKAHHAKKHVEVKKLEAKKPVVHHEVKKAEHKKVEAKKVEHKKVDAKKVEAKKVEHKKVEHKKVEHKKEEHKKVEHKKEEHKKEEHKKVEHKKVEAKKVEAKKVEHKKVEAKKHHEVKKPNHKQVSETKNGDEIVKKYPHGQVHISAKGHSSEEAKPVAKKHVQKKVAKQEEPTEEPTEDSSDSSDDGSEETEGSTDGDEPTVGENEDDVTEEQDFPLKVGDSVDITVDGETITLKHFANGSVVMYAGADVTVIDAKNIYLDFEVDEDSEASLAGSNATEATIGSSSGAAEESLVGGFEKDVSGVAKKFSELATKLTGNGFKEAAPIIFIGGAIGALAAVVGIAAIAIGRARSNSAAADPQSVLADATEDVEADVEAGETEEKKEDASADESQALDSSDSESEADEEQEEGKFTNEVASV